MTAFIFQVYGGGLIKITSEVEARVGLEGEARFFLTAVASTADVKSLNNSIKRLSEF